MFTKGSFFVIKTQDKGILVHSRFMLYYKDTGEKGIRVLKVHALS